MPAPLGSTRSRFVLDPDMSALLVATRSSVGPIEFATTHVTGTAEVAVTDGAIDTQLPATAALRVPVDSLSSGNSLYDAQVRERLDSRLFPTITLELRGAQALDSTNWALTGDLTIHGTTRTLAGSADIRLVDATRLRVRGEQIIDIRDFAIELPSALMLRIFPDVTVRFHFEAVREG